MQLDFKVKAPEVSTIIIQQHLSFPILTIKRKMGEESTEIYGIYRKLELCGL